MSAISQLVMLGVNFIYGFLIFFVAIINYSFVKNETIIVKLLLTLLFALDFSILYLIIVYKINCGIFHFYYLIAFAAGFLLAYFIKKHVKIMTIKEKIIDIKFFK